MGFLLLLLPLLAACVSDFDGSRTGNDRELIMSYRMFNTTDSQELTVAAGDNIHVEITAERGQISLTIQRDGETPLYQAEEIASSDAFDLQANKDGTYTVSVTGKKAKGAISVAVQK